MSAGEAPQGRFSLATLTAMVVGSMIGAGIFSLPATFGRATGVVGGLIAWAIAGSGMLMLALVFQSLSRRKPELDAGVYAYARAGFGDYPGFLSALGYWAGTCLGNVTYFVLIKATLGAVVPAFGDGNTIQAVAASSVILWGVHALILRGVSGAAVINSIATVAKVLPILLFVVLVAVAVDRDVLLANLWGGEDVGLAGIAAQVRSTMLVTVFVFLGVEGASVYSRYARRREDVGIATVTGFLGVLVLMVLVTMLSYGVLPRAELGALRNPSMAGVLQAVVGPWGAVFVSAGLIISVLGAYLSWSLLAAEVLYTAARTEDMPRFLGHENANRVPSTALWLTNIVVQLFLVLTLFAEEAFTFVLKLSSAMNLIPYLLVAAYALTLARSGETYAAAPRERRADLVRAGLATVYTAFLIWAGGLKFVLLSAIIYAPGTLLYVRARRERGRATFTPVEAAVCAAMVVAALAGVAGLATGRITV